MPIASQADLEAIRGPQYLDRLLNSARDPNADSVTNDAYKQARLDQALQAGDDLIRQFLDLDAIADDSIALATVLRIAIDEALYYLQSHSETKPSEHDDERARIRRSDLAYMRKREQFPGKPVGQASVTSGVVTVTSTDNPWSRDGMKGFR